jgi:hypothetical protein
VCEREREGDQFSHPHKTTEKIERERGGPVFTPTQNNRKNRERGDQFLHPHKTTEKKREAETSSHTHTKQQKK